MFNSGHHWHMAAIERGGLISVHSTEMSSLGSIEPDGCLKEVAWYTACTWWQNYPNPLFV